MNDPQTWTTVWELTVGAVGWDGQRRAKGKNWDNCNKITIKTLYNAVENRFICNRLYYLLKRSLRLGYWLD